MSSDDTIGIDAVREGSKAVQEASKFGVKAIEALEKLGSFFGKVVGSVPEDAVGILGGDWLSHFRIRNLAALQLKTDDILKSRNIYNDTRPLSGRLAIACFKGAANESDEDLQTKWARLLANALDKTRNITIRRAYFGTLEKLEPLDVILLDKMSITISSSDRFYMSIKEVRDLLDKSFYQNLDELDVSLKNLLNLGLVDYLRSASDLSPIAEDLHITSYGRELLRSCAE